MIKKEVAGDASFKPFPHDDLFDCRPKTIIADIIDIILIDIPWTVAADPA